MIRLIILVALVFAAVLGFAWLKDAPGELALTVNDRVYVVGLARAALALLVVVATALVVIWIIGLLWRAPGRAVRAWRNSREGQIRSVLAQGLIAVAAGDMRAAERAAAEAMRRAPRAPLTRLLQAQVAEVKGEFQEAQAVFTAMLEDPRTRIAGLRGMHLEAERDGNAEAARHYAQAAHELAPGAAWANRALLRAQIAARDWDGALATLAASAQHRAADKRALRRHRAVILTAQSLELEGADPQKAQRLALEAHSLAPDLAPAATVAGRILARLGDVRRAAKVLETSWKAAPHPDIAEAYGHVRSGDSARDRLKRIETLMKMRPQADEGRLALVRAAIDARDWALARETLVPVLRTRPTQNAFVLMAEIEEGEHGDRGRAREFLSRAVRAPRDPAWVADGVVLEEWAPASPVSGRIDAVEWRVPAERLGGREAIEVDEEALRPTPLLPVAAERREPQSGVPKAAARVEAPAPRPSSSGSGSGAGAETHVAAPPRSAPAAPREVAIAAGPPASQEVPPPAPVRAAAPAAAAASPAGGDPDDRAAPGEAASPADAAAGPAGGGDGAGASEPTGTQAPVSGNGTDADRPAPSQDAAEEGAEPPDPITLPQPDDPGIEEADTGEEPERRRFRLF